jgi:Ni,Fe-hydrogenase maturation factor
MSEKKTIVLYFGNELIPEDRLAIEVVGQLKDTFPKIDFIHCHSPEDILNYKDYKKIVIVDVSPNVDDLTVVENLDALKKRDLFTLHDFDLNFFLKLAEKTGDLKTKDVKIIALPVSDEKKKLVEKLSKALG